MPEFENRQEWEARLKRELLRLTEPQTARLMKLLGNPPDVANVPASFWAGLGDDLAQTLKPALQQIYVESAQQTLMTVPRIVRVDWHLANVPAATWAEQHSFDLVKGVNETSQVKLQGYVSGFFTNQGTTIGDLTDQIAPLFGPVRAELIATTEVTRASVEGQSGIVDLIEEANPAIKMIPIWDTNLDEYVCPICRPRHNKEQGKGWEEPPPAHPRCRCALRYDVQVTKKGKR